MVDLKTLAAAELEQFIVDLGLPAYRGRQIYRWMYALGVSEFESMSDLPATLRSRLEQVAFISSLTFKKSQESSDGTIKSLYQINSGKAIETVLIPDFDSDRQPKRMTACVSSQVGCAMDCSFCATGKMGFHQNLSSGEIYDQVYCINQLAIERYGKSLTNIVFMGMGEPLLNFQAVCDSVQKISSKNGLAMAPRRITISTVGLADQIKKLADQSLKTNLAVSLHAPSDKKRSSIMPVNRKAKTDLRALRSAIKYYSEKTKRRVTYEYCLFKDFNDTTEDAIHLSEIAHWVPSKVNLIMYNPVDGVLFERSDDATVNEFVRELLKRRVRVTVRKSRGIDIDAACGQLALN